MKKIIKLLILTLITVANGYGQTSYDKYSQNKSSNGLGTTEQYVYTNPSTGNLTINVSLDILTIAKNLGTATNITQTFFGYGESNSIPPDWSFEVELGTDYAFSENTITYTGSTTLSKDLNVNLIITFDDGNTLATVIKYRIAGLFTVATGMYNSCEGIYVLTVNEHTSGSEVLSSPYEIELYTPTVASGGMVSGYPMSINTNIIDFSGLNSANYECVVTNLLGQSVSTTFTINDAYAPVAQVNFAGFECEDSSQGMIDITVDGGSVPISWSLLLDGIVVSTNINSDGSIVGVGTGNGVGTGDFDTVGVDIIISNLGSGEYSFEFEDDNGCGGTIDVPVVVPLPILLEEPPVQNDVTCFDGADGYFIFNVSGGWTQAFSENIFNPLPPGNWGGSYDFTLINSTTGATYNTPIVNAINDDSEVQLYWQVFYADLPAGTYTLTVSETVSTASIQRGNTPVVEYSWSKTFGPFELTKPTELDILEILTDVSCNAGTDGNIIVSVTGGNPPYIFKFDDGTLVTPISSSSENYTIGNLSAGNYTIIVTYQNDCTATNSVIQEITEPAEIS
jgi:hypothetical protein